MSHMEYDYTRSRSDIQQLAQKIRYPYYERINNLRSHQYVDESLLVLSVAALADRYAEQASLEKPPRYVSSPLSNL